MNHIYHLDSNIQSILCINHERAWKMYFAILQRQKMAEVSTISLFMDPTFVIAWLYLIDFTLHADRAGPRNRMTGLGELAQTKGKVVCRQNTPGILWTNCISPFSLPSPCNPYSTTRPQVSRPTILTDWFSRSIHDITCVDSDYPKQNLFNAQDGCLDQKVLGLSVYIYTYINQLLQFSKVSY